MKRLCAILLFCATASALNNTFTDYNDIRDVLIALKLDASITPRAWRDWVARHNREVRARLQRGDEDTIINWLLFGTSFTRQPRALIDRSGRDVVAGRVKDFVAALSSPGTDERRLFAVRFLAGRDYRFDSQNERNRLEQYLSAGIDRVIEEQQRYAREAAEIRDSADLKSQLAAESKMFLSRGLSLDTSILPNFAIDEALQEMRQQQLIARNSVRRVAIVGPGL